MKIKYLTAQQLIELNKQVVLTVGGTNYGVQSVEALHVVIEQPAQVVFGHELYPTIWLKAAFILQKITKKHVFVDGNKRTALMASLYFINQNDYQLINNKIVNQAGDFVLSVTNSPDNEETMRQIANWLQEIHKNK
ncbi:type II toxin-antitoxin system death-on-curing family toxin [Pediococcus ethanolidurans]|uniref:Death on curing protein n=1 Tax=Pediococcus ethanolidurans TaxID=319653 RepID=A0A0R2K0Y4_9LACO|nr:type II toxin-antitoxin system death-on-curing family toxin [Pediococcus ethanolidurans]KRN83249.1 toxin-antitoxin system, toxin component, Fic family protein [Pediococcus ethanolidurans]GEN94615.1 death-on-curing family protein [Pediococcus ethanolidurans]SER30985.1 death on curing protein [Pediococcus ethanolidurans]